MTHGGRIEGYDEAVRAVQELMSPRARLMARLERFVEGTQYEGLPDFFAADAKVSLFQRAPCIVYPVVRTAIDSNVDLLLGDGRFPVVTSRPDEDSDFDDDGELSEDESEIYDRFVVQAHKQSRFRPLCREVFADAQATKSGCAIFGVRNGRFFGDTIKARWAEPEFDVDGAVTRLVIQYGYVDQAIVNRRWRAVPRIYRRVIDAQRDVTYLPADAKVSPETIAWAEDPQRSVDHGLGFCPVVWYPHMRGCAAVSEFDGRAIHEHILPSIHAHDLVLSQRHRAALYAGDPQWTEAGVEDGYNPSEGRKGMGVPASLKGGPISADNPAAGSYRDPSTPRRVRVKSPGRVWQYPDKDVKVQLHTLPGDALKALDEHAHDLRQKLAEALCVVFLDPENVKFAATVSGKALETLKQRQLDRLDQYRADFGDKFIVPATNMLSRIADKIGPGGVRLPVLDAAAPVLAKFRSEDEAAA